MARTPDVASYPGEHGAAPAARRSARDRIPGFVRRHPWLCGIVAALIVLVAVVHVVGLSLSDRLRRTAEARMNDALDGYRVSIGELRLNVFGLGLDLEDVVVVQTEHPDPPVARLPRFGASIQWSALLSGDVVGDLVLDQPDLFVDLTHFRSEAKDDRALDERGWQDAVRRIYPLEINAFRVNDGRLTYDDGSELGPIRIEDVELVARNIRNVASSEGELPSPLRFDARVFGEGHASFDGSADFLAEPHAAIDGSFELDDVPLEPLTPIARHFAVQLAGGTLAARGRLAYAPDGRRVEIEDAEVDGIHADFVRAGGEAARGERVAEKAARGATDPSEAPRTQVRVERLRLTDGELGWVDPKADPAYRVFVSRLDATVEGFSNDRDAAPGKLEARGALMGSGTAVLEATFQPMDARAEFGASLRIQDVDLRTLNDVLQANGGFDVVAGNFSLFSEVNVRDGRIDGYVKPLFGELDVYHPEQDGDESIFQQAYEGIVGGVGELLENRPRDEVATRTDISGSVENPDSSVWEIIGNLVRNAFFDAILPGLERRAAG